MQKLIYKYSENGAVTEQMSSVKGQGPKIDNDLLCCAHTIVFESDSGRQFVIKNVDGKAGYWTEPRGQLVQMTDRLVLDHSVHAVRTEIAEVLELLSQLRVMEKEALRKTQVGCHFKACQKYTAIGELTFIMLYEYNSNTGSPNGGYWEPDVGGFKCPHCSIINRLHNRPEVSKLEPYFKETIREDRKSY